MLVTTKLCFSYGQSNVLDSLDLTVHPGQIVGLLGANGAGKTTLFRIVAGLLRPDSGEVEIAGSSMRNNATQIKRIVGIVPDESLLYPTLSASENLNMFALLWGINAPEKSQHLAESLLRQVGLWEVRDQWVNGYSRGMQQKLSICAALLHEPRLLLLDEPFSGLDITAGFWARELLRDLADKGRAILFSSHIPEAVAALATHICVLHRGQIVAYEPADTIGAGSGVEDFYRSAIGQS